MRRWWPHIALLIVIVLLLARFQWGEGGRTQLVELRERVSEQHKVNAELQLRNDALLAEVRDLKEGEDALEERARSELGMIKPGETFYRVLEDKPSAEKDSQ